MPAARAAAFPLEDRLPAHKYRSDAHHIPGLLSNEGSTNLEKRTREADVGDRPRVRTEEQQRDAAPRCTSRTNVAHGG